MDDIPAVITLGSRQVREGLSRVWAELGSGAVIQVIDRKMGRRKGWIVPEVAPGSVITPISCQDFARRLGMVLDCVRDGTVFEVIDRTTGKTRAFLQWEAPEAIGRLDLALTFISRGSRTGRRRLREIMPREAGARR